MMEIRVAAMEGGVLTVVVEGDDDVGFMEMMVRVTREMAVRVAGGCDGRGGVAGIRPERGDGQPVKLEKQCVWSHFLLGFPVSVKLKVVSSLNELRSPDFNLLSDQEYSEEEVAKTMAETMEHGLDHEDANEHIEKVLKIVDLFHIPNISIDQVMLRAFPMSLTRAASRWLGNKPTGSITTWEDLKTKFLSKYCPPARTAKKMEEINNFQQEPDENLYQAWEQFKELLMKCPQHYLTEMEEVVLFYNWLDVPTRQILDSRGVIPFKTIANAKIAIKNG
ncbi:retrovirus-related pol polyprotein from transposon TNT 1-94 [Tanacetum coccineum]|uniref:Retrovirus-related pol polyprotein from transposon TNT 1-94 n=1 Tax=Tanacetum coccineum TaxID=301880 RepID=A0ABQ4XMI7_9ASTR